MMMLADSGHGVRIGAEQCCVLKVGSVLVTSPQLHRLYTNLEKPSVSLRRN